MFKKLKDKIAEEVKSSPQRVQQLAQGVQAVVQSATGPLMQEDNTLPENAERDGSFTNISLQNSTSPSHKRRNSNSSFASDVSFLPSFESHANLYHLQSDLEASASEIEDSYSGQLERVSKEQLLQAFRRMQMKYNKYRGRYTDLANHYRALERENAQVKSILVETQDKALRRVSELKEQCSLEQSAKAHMENVLREDLIEKQYLIDTLNTKIQLLQNPSITDKLISLDQDLQPLEDVQKQSSNLQKEIEDIMLKEKHNLEIIRKQEEDFKHKVDEHSNIVAKLNYSIQEKDVQINTLKTDSEAQKDVIKQLEAYKIELAEKYNSQTIIITELKENERSILNKYETSVLDFKKAIAEKDALVNSLKENLIKQQKTIENNLTKLQEGNEMITKLEQTIAKKDSEIKTFANNVRQLKDEISKSNTIEENEHLHKISTLQEFQREKENEIIKLKQDVENCNKEINEKVLQKDNVITNLNQDISNLTTELENYKQLIENSTLEVTKLNDEIKSNLNEIMNLKETIVTHKEENNNCKRIWKEKESEIAKLKESITNKDGDLLEFKKALKEYKANENNFEKQINEHEKKLEQLRNNIGKSEKEVEEYQQKILTKEEKINNLKLDISNSELIEHQLKSQIEEYEQTVHEKDTEINNIREQLEENIRAKENYCKEIETLKKSETEQNSDLSEKLRNSEKNIGKLQKEKEKINKKLEQQKSNYEKTELSYKEKINKNEIQMKDIQNQVDELLIEKNLQLEKIKTDENEINKLKQNLKENTNLVNELNLTNIDKDVEIQNINEELHNQSKTNNELNIAIKENNKTLNTVKEELSAKSALVDEMEKKTKELELDLQNTKSTLDSERSKNEQLTISINGLKHDIEQTVNNELLKLQESLSKINLEKEELIKTKETVTSDFKIKEREYQQEISQMSAKLETEKQLFLDIDKKYNEVLQESNNIRVSFKNDIDAFKLQTAYLENEQVLNKETYEANEKKMIDTINKLEVRLNQAGQDKKEHKLLQEENARLTKELKDALDKYEEVSVENKVIYNEIQQMKQTLENDQKLLYELKQINDSFNAEKEENKKLIEEITILRNSLQEIENKLEQDSESKTIFNDEVKELKENIETSNLVINELRENIVSKEEMNIKLTIENEDLQKLLKESTKTEEKNYREEIKMWGEQMEEFTKEISTLQQELVETRTYLDDAIENKEKLEVLLEAANFKLNEKQTKTEDVPSSNITMNEHKNGNNNIEATHYENEIRELEDKISLYENMEITAKESVQYLQNELDKMKNKNEKLKSKLDETLVTLDHCADLSSSTEMEYLKNILYNYMIGKESIVLARVIAAVCKFDSMQTETVLQKEHQKQTLLGQLGIL